MGALLAAGSAQAGDSARVLWNTNGHYYQLFERGSITWPNAKTACESISAHLATITSAGEQGFIQSQLLASRFHGWYHIGGTDAASQFKWKWITGEPWAYENWDSGNNQPSNGTGEDYLFIADNYDESLGEWRDGTASDTEFGYICEWSTQNYIDTTLIPNQNNNGVDEVAELFVDYKTGKHTVQIKDPKSDTLLKTLVFATSFTPPSGMVLLNDANGNGAPEIGVLFTQFGFPSVQIRDVKSGAKLRDINFMTPGYKPKSVGVGADADNNGADEIVVLGIAKTTGKAKAEIRDSKTGNISNDTTF